ncbi:MAG: hypothetical protein R3324_13090, partial [Halobacteriales archaeon]|nr:hypothetical protein [Halobacteriales archaeon]
EVVRNGDDQGGGIVVEGLARPVALAVRSGSLYAAANTADAVVIFQRDATEGTLTFDRVVRQGDDRGDGVLVDGLLGVTSLVITGDGTRAYVAGEDSDAIAVFDRDTGDGSLFFSSLVRDGEAGVAGLAGPRAVTTAGDGTHVYGAGTLGDSIVVFAGPDPLSFVESESDGGGTLAPGDPVTYTIEVSNHGPSRVVDAEVSDSFPVQLEDVSWTCTVVDPDPGNPPEPSEALCSNSGSGDLADLVTLPPGLLLRYEATGTVKPGASGALVNTATVTVPPGVIDRDPGNNSATDDDTTLGFVADLGMEKINLTGEAVPGASLTYQLTVSNQGPSDARDVTVVDRLPETLLEPTWTCVATPRPGLLRWAEQEIEGQESVTGLIEPRTTTVSPDGEHLYAVGADSSGNGTVVVFDRDLRTGTLTWRQTVTNGADGVGGLQGGIGIVVSADGNHVYVAAEAS